MSVVNRHTSVHYLRNVTYRLFAFVNKDRLTFNKIGTYFVYLPEVFAIIDNLLVVSHTAGKAYDNTMDVCFLGCFAIPSERAISEDYIYSSLK